MLLSPLSILLHFSEMSFLSFTSWKTIIFLSWKTIIYPSKFQVLEFTCFQEISPYKHASCYTYYNILLYIYTSAFPNKLWVQKTTFTIDAQ